MIIVGYIPTKNFRLWVNQGAYNPPLIDSKCLELPYYEVLLSEIKDVFYYVDLRKDERFNVIFKLDKGLRPTPGTNMMEYNSMMDRKDQAQPMFMISRQNLESLIDIVTKM